MDAQRHTQKPRERVLGWLLPSVTTVLVATALIGHVLMVLAVCVWVITR